MGAVETARSTARRAAYSPTVEAIARVGYAIRGVLYILIGLLALRLALGIGGQQPSPQGALATIAQQPAGHVLLWIVFIGLLAYALWCLIKAVFNVMHQSAGSRFGSLINAVVYAFLAWTAYAFINGNSSAAASGGSQSKFLAQIMMLPAGRLIAGAVGLIIVLVGISLMGKGVNGTFERDFNSYALTRDEARMARQTGRLGTFAQGLVLAIIGLLIMYAAYTSNPGQATGINSVFTTLMAHPYGVAVVLILGLGLVAFGIYSLMAAAWFRLRRS